MLEDFGAFVVEKIFFTKIRAGPVRLRLLWIFFMASILVFVSSIQKINQGGVCPNCRFSSETVWYSKALKFRAERNFWLSLFNSFLWVLVWKVYDLKKRILRLKDRIKELEAKLLNIAEQATEEIKKKDESPTEETPKDEQSKKED